MVAETIQETTFHFPSPLTASSPELQQLFDFIASGAAERDRDSFATRVRARILPYDVVDLIRRSRLGAEAFTQI